MFLDKIYKWLNIRIKQHLYEKMIEEERLSEIDTSVEQAKLSMMLFRESLIKVYGHNKTNSDNN